MDSLDVLREILAEVRYRVDMNMSLTNADRRKYKKVIDALDKQIPKKPIEDGYYDEPCVCPNCGSNVINEADNDYLFNYCYHCGQALDWSEDNG